MEAADNVAEDYKRLGAVRDACDKHLADLAREYTFVLPYLNLSCPKCGLFEPCPDCIYRSGKNVDH